MRELGSEEKKEEREVFVERKKKKQELWGMWIGEGYKENEKEKEMAGNRQEHIKHIKNTILSKEAEDSSLIV